MTIMVDCRDAAGLGTGRVLGFHHRGSGRSQPADRFLTLDGRPIYFTGSVCDTSSFWLERLADVDHAVSVDEVRGRLAAGLSNAGDPVVEALAAILPGPADYVIMLLDVVPRLVRPYGPADWYVDVPLTWRGNPKRPLVNELRLPFYRGTYRRLDAVTDLCELIVPLVDPDRLHLPTVNAYRERILVGERPTAVALSVFDVRNPHSDDYYELLLTHYLLDGHHKLFAAATAGLPVRLLAFLTRAEGLNDPREIDRLTDLLRQPNADQEWPSLHDRLLAPENAT